MSRTHQRCGRSTTNTWREGSTAVRYLFGREVGCVSEDEDEGEEEEGVCQMMKTKRKMEVGCVSNDEDEEEKGSECVR